MRKISMIAALAVLVVQPVRAQAPALVWGPAPPIFPAGAKMAVLQGDPGKPEQFTVRLDLPSGYRVAPHYHPTNEYITVIKGTFLLGMGDKADASHAMTLETGTFATVTANEHHFASARGHTIVQVSAMGPFVLTYVNSADDPSQKTRAR